MPNRAINKTSEELEELQAIRQEIIRLNSKVESLETQLTERVTREEFQKFQNSCWPVIIETLPLLKKLERNYESLRRIISANRLKEQTTKETQKQMITWFAVIAGVLGGGSGLEVLKHLIGGG